MIQFHFLNFIQNNFIIKFLSFFCLNLSFCFFTLLVIYNIILYITNKVKNQKLITIYYTIT